MKANFLLFTFTFLWLNGFGQDNLVFNGDFEEMSDCPNYLTLVGPDPEISKCIGWRAPTQGTSDFFNACSANMSVPSNVQGFQYASSGVGYLGIIANQFSSTEESYVYREYIQGELIEPLHAGVTYEFSFDINLANEFQFSLDEFGAYFSEDSVGSQGAEQLDYTPQCSFPKSNFYSDTASWVHLEANFVATGDEQFVTIGCFKDPSELEFYNYFDNDTIGYLTSYYFIDNVKLVRKYVNPPLPNVFTPNNDGSNDLWKAKECVYCEEELEIIIRNRWGDTVVMGNLHNFAWNGMDAIGRPCSAGTYYYTLSNGKSGFIQLVR